LIIKDTLNTHAQRVISFLQIKQGIKNEITSSQKSKVLTSNQNSQHFSQWHQVPKRKGFVFQKHTLEMEAK
jgi:hypothetical protein